MYAMGGDQCPACQAVFVPIEPKAGRFSECFFSFSALMHRYQVCGNEAMNEDRVTVLLA